jgi:hypothetical protein
MNLSTVGFSAHRSQSQSKKKPNSKESGKASQLKQYRRPALIFKRYIDRDSKSIVQKSNRGFFRLTGKR